MLGDAALEAGDQAVLAQLKVALENLDFVERLDRIRQDKALLVEGKLNYAATSPLYETALKNYGFDVVGADLHALRRKRQSTPSPPVIRRCRASPDRDE